jgi:hypothetical protein
VSWLRPSFVIFKIIGSRESIDWFFLSVGYCCPIIVFYSGHANLGLLLVFRGVIG